ATALRWRNTSRTSSARASVGSRSWQASRCSVLGGATSSMVLVMAFTLSGGLRVHVARQDRRDFVDEIGIDGDEPVLAGLAHGNDAGVGQDLQVMRDGRLRQVKVGLDLAARQLAGAGDLARHPHP